MNILLVNMSLIKEAKFQREDYWTDSEGKETIDGYFTNEAPCKYLVQKLWKSTYQFFDRIIVLATPECVKKRFDCAGNKTTVEYFQDEILSYMYTLDAERFHTVFGSKEVSEEAKNDLFKVVEVNFEDDKINPALLKALQENVDNPWDANLYLDFTGGSRTVSLVGIMAMRCLDSLGYKVRAVVHSAYEITPHRILDLTFIYGAFDAIIASANLRDPDFAGVLEDQKQVMANNGMLVDVNAYGGNPEDVKNYADSYNGKEPFIFLSYAHKDMLFAQSFLKNMHRRGISRIWYDEGIKPSMEWEKTIYERIDQCSCFLVLVSQNYLDSDFCSKEIERAKKNSHKTLYISLDGHMLSEKFGVSDKEQVIMQQKYKHEEFYDKVMETQWITEYISTEDIFINFSSHPSEKWASAQRKAAEEYGTIKDILFPEVDPFLPEERIIEIAEEYVQKIASYHPRFVLCQGEFCVSYHVASMLKELGFKVGAACSERKVQERNTETGTERLSYFEFVRFREY